LNPSLLLPPSRHDWLPEKHLARFVADVVETLDLSAFYRSYEEKDGRGQAAYHPVVMLRLLLYGYCVGVFSSRGTPTSAALTTASLGVANNAAWPCLGLAGPDEGLSPGSGRGRAGKPLLFNSSTVSVAIRTCPPGVASLEMLPAATRRRIVSGLVLSRPAAAPLL
jgi:hypothetical protein